MQNPPLQIDAKSSANRLSPGIWRKDLGAGAAAVLDQGFFALGNFVMNLLLARWLAPRSYGAFTFSYSLFLLVGTVHTSLFTEPMMIFGSRTYLERFPAYLRSLLKGHLLFMMPLSGAAVLAYLFLREHGFTDLANAFLGLSGASVLILLSWLLRAATYVRLKPHLAAMGGAIYLTLITVLSALLHAAHLLTIPTAFLLISCSSLLSSIFLAVSLRIGTDIRADRVSGIRLSHWNYGRWAIAASAISWIPTNAYYLVLPLRFGMDSTAALRAIMNPVMPVLQGVSALSLLLLPRLTRLRGTQSFRTELQRATRLFVGAAIAYAIALAFFGSSVLRLMYGNKYATYSTWPIVCITGFIPIGGALVAAYGPALRALERPDKILRSYLITAAFTVTVSLGVVYLYGPMAAVVMMVITPLITGLMMRKYLIELEQRENARSETLCA